jgi:hypothetical protein
MKCNRTRRVAQVVVARRVAAPTALDVGRFAALALDAPACHLAVR